MVYSKLLYKHQTSFLKIFNEISQSLADITPVHSESIFFLTGLLGLLGLDNQLTDFLHYHLSYLALSLLQYFNYYKIILNEWK